MAQYFLPLDSVALALGADEVAQALLAEHHQVIRTGSRGLLWLEPMLEIDSPQGRMGFGKVNADDVPAIIAQGAQHAKCLGVVGELPYLKKQQRLSFSRLGVIDPLSIADYRANGGFVGLAEALAQPHEIVTMIIESGLRGRGGAAFPTGIKWRTVAEQKSAHKYIVCNADEGDSGSFSDRMLLEGDPLALIEGMIIAGIATGATMGYIYIRSEYPNAFKIVEQAVAAAYAEGYLGEHVMGSPYRFELKLRKAAGAYVCGDETAMLESIEGKRGIVRSKPPIPALSGLFGCPTVINNVITLAAVPGIVTEGAAHYQSHGVHHSRGTLPFQLAGNIKYGGLVEVEFGLTLRQLVEDFGGGTKSGKKIKAIQVGGPLGSYVPESMWDLPLDYELYTRQGATLGHGGIVVHDEDADLSQLARYAFEFCALESCGKCTPCRIGAQRGVEVIDKITANIDRLNNLDLLDDLCETMVNASMCAMGGMTPNPVRSALRYYPEDFRKN